MFSTKSYPHDIHIIISHTKKKIMPSIHKWNSASTVCVHVLGKNCTLTCKYIVLKLKRVPVWMSGRHIECSLPPVILLHVHVQSPTQVYKCHIECTFTMGNTDFIQNNSRKLKNQWFNHHFNSQHFYLNSQPS